MNGTETSDKGYGNWTQNRRYERRFIGIVIFAEAFTSVLVVFGNFFIIALIQRKKLLGRSTNVFVFSIAVADFMNGAFSIPAHVTSVIYDDVTTQVYLCKGYKFIMYLTKTVVPYTILFMMAEKVMRILCPTREIVTVARCMFFTSLLWFFASSFNIWSVVLFTVEAHPFFDTNQTRSDSLMDKIVPHRCILGGKFESLHQIFLIADFIILFAIPFIGVICLHIVLLVKYFTVLRERIVTYFYVIKLVMALFFNVIITHLPLEVMTFFENLQDHSSWTVYCTSYIVVCLHFTRGVWNIAIYGYFKHYVCRKRHMASIRATSSVDNRYKLRVPSSSYRRNNAREVK